MLKIESLLIATMLLCPLSGVGASSQNTAEQGIDIVEVAQAKATVENIDLEKRKLKVKLEDGKNKTIKVDRSIRNLDQLKVGDTLNLTYAEEIIVLIGQTKEQAGAAIAGLVAVAPKGAKLPGGVMVETASLTAKIVSVDPQKRHIVLLEPDGKKKTVKLSKKATGLDKLKPGETIDMVITEALAIQVSR